jgi:hypothetical protein
MAIQFPRGFLVTTDEPIDIKLVLTKSQMAKAEELFMMPSPYFCLCSDDNKIYIYDVRNEVVEDPTKEFYGLGHFRPTDIEVKSLIKAETDRAVEVENELAAAIEAESAARLTKDTELTDLLTNETLNRTAADEGLDSKIKALEENTNTKIDQEITDRQNEIVRVEGLIATEATTRTTAVDDLQGQINTITANIASGLHFRGIKEALSDITDPANGDIIIIGTQEYIYADGE